jgi:uncharacterized membrane protein YcgQ (UPF0703/DUF1980 family)
MSEYLDLYEAIWVQAVEDDINKAVKELYEVAFKNAYEVLIEKRLWKKKKDAIVKFSNSRTVDNVVKLLKETQPIKLLGEFENATLYGTKYNYIIVTKTAFYIIKNIKRIENFNSELSEYCGIRARDVEQRIKELVYRESQEWPENKDYKIRDKEYNKILTQLKEEVAEYAKEKMKRCWYKL